MATINHVDKYHLNLGYFVIKSIGSIYILIYMIGVLLIIFDNQYLGSIKIFVTLIKSLVVLGMFGWLIDRNWLKKIFWKIIYLNLIFIFVISLFWIKISNLYDIIEAVLAFPAILILHSYVYKREW